MIFQLLARSRRDFLGCILYFLQIFFKNYDYLGQFWIDYAYKRSKMFFSCFLEKKYVFSVFFDAKSAHFKSTKWCQGVPKIEFFSKSILYSFLVLRAPLKMMRPSEIGFGHYKCVFWEFFLGCWELSDEKNSFFVYFRWFLMIFDDFARSQLFGSVSRACTGAQESKKVEIAKNELKHPQTIIECHTKGFKVRLGGLGCHMSQSIFLDFRWFWGVFGGNMSYMPYMSITHQMSLLKHFIFLEKIWRPSEKKYEKVKTNKKTKKSKQKENFPFCLRKNAKHNNNIFLFFSKSKKSWKRSRTRDKSSPPLWCTGW